MVKGIRAGAGLAAMGAVPRVLRAEGRREAGDEGITGKGSLKAHAAKKGLLTGCAVDMALLRGDEGYRSLMAEQYSIVVGENCMKFKAMEPEAGKYFFGDADALVGFAEAHGMKVRGHNFVWHEALPDWFAGTVTKENAKKIMTDHILAVGGRYQGRIHSWDVVNEAVWPKDGRPDGLRSSSPWFEMMGPEYLEIAFRTARQADPKALLTYNDYGIEYDTEEESTKRRAVLGLLRRLKAANVPVDAVGIQSHIHAGAKDGYDRGVAELTRGAKELGLEVFVTELDVKDDGVEFDDMALRDKAVAATYLDYLTEVLKSREVKAVLTWGVSDAHTWLNHGTAFRKAHPGREQRPLPFDGELKPTAAFFAMREAFDGAKKRG
jgi:endo-1,4-beta-xylanase